MSSLPDEQALSFFHQGYSCAQSVLAPFAARLGMTETAALKLASGFGAGMGRMRGVCGAFSSLVMIAGCCRGNTSGRPEDKERIYQCIRSLAGRFRTQFGALHCRELLQLAENSAESARPLERTSEYYASRPCERCVLFCARWADELLRDDAGKASPLP